MTLQINSRPRVFTYGRSRHRLIPKKKKEKKNTEKGNQLELHFYISLAKNNRNQMKKEEKR